MDHPTSTFDPRACAATLLDSWRSGQHIDALPPQQRPSSLAEGYDAQDELIAGAGDARGGWKIGVGSPAQLRAFKLARPLVGQVARARCHPDNAMLRFASDTPLTMEFEIAFSFARDVPPGAALGSVSDVIGSTFITFEIVRSRFVNRGIVGWPSFVADNVGFEALVVSAPIEVDSLREIYATAEVRLDGEVASPILGGDDAIDPMLSMQALLDHAAERGITLKAGDIVTTGTMCKPFDVAGKGHHLSGRYLGKTLNFRY